MVCLHLQLCRDLLWGEECAPLAQQGSAHCMHMHDHSDRLACGALNSSFVITCVCVKWWLCSAVICIASIALFHFIGDAEIGVHNLVGGGKHGE